MLGIADQDISNLDDQLAREFIYETGYDHYRLLQKLVYVNGEIGEVTEVSGRLNLCQFTMLRCIKYMKAKNSALDDDSTFDSQLTSQARRPDFADQEMAAAGVDEIVQDLGMEAQTRKVE